MLFILQLIAVVNSFTINNRIKNISPQIRNINDYNIDKVHTFEKTLLNTHTPESFVISQLKNINDYDIRYINILYKSIFRCVNCTIPKCELKTIQLGLIVAYVSHINQKRRSGEPFIIHPVSVANIIAESGADSNTIISGLLHDTVEDTPLTFNDIESIFGNEVRKIVEGETKISKIPKHMRKKNLPYKNYIEIAKNEQNENLRNMFIAMADDWRIIVVKLADRLHNMRTLQHMPIHKQMEISKETLRLFVPLAHRLGLWKFKTELEDLSFKYVYPEKYTHIRKDLDVLKTKYNKTLEIAQSDVHNLLFKNNSLYSFRIEARTKSMYSIWKKMENRNCNIEGILDLLAIRIIIEPVDTDNIIINDDISLCYYILGIIHRMWTPIPKTLKDYITSPKPNGYRSLHTTVLINSQPVEIQIRTKEMHQIAEWGTAVHWGYKSTESNLSWLQVVRKWDNQVNSSSVFMDRVKKELLGSRVFVFGPNGQILNLAKGAQLIDAINKICHFNNKLNISVNGQKKPLDYYIKNGDIISL
tara:strand:- start:880 stop:2472 length:1593 start_codon:yes stop_codon:yes gene_type:complete